MCFNTCSSKSRKFWPPSHASYGYPPTDKTVASEREAQSQELGTRTIHSALHFQTISYRVVPNTPGFLLAPVTFLYVYPLHMAVSNHSHRWHLRCKYGVNHSAYLQGSRATPLIKACLNVAAIGARSRPWRDLRV